VCASHRAGPAALQAYHEPRSVAKTGGAGGTLGGHRRQSRGLRFSRQAERAEQVRQGRATWLPALAGDAAGDGPFLWASRVSAVPSPGQAGRRVAGGRPASAGRPVGRSPTAPQVGVPSRRGKRLFPGQSGCRSGLPGCSPPRAGVARVRAAVRVGLPPRPDSRVGLVRRGAAAGNLAERPSPCYCLLRNRPRPPAQRSRVAGL
jgi:hypothetical protein